MNTESIVVEWLHSIEHTLVDLHFNVDEVEVIAKNRLGEEVNFLLNIYEKDMLITFVQEEITYILQSSLDDELFSIISSAIDIYCIAEYIVSKEDLSELDYGIEVCVVDAYYFDDYVVYELEAE